MAGERVFPVPSLRTPDPAELPPIEELAAYEAVALFVERASAASGEFALGEENAPFVAQICHRLDGMPLALELAAARVKVLSPRQIAERLDDTFGLLAGGTRTALARHQTLRATMDWSFDLLTEPEQVLARRLSVFAGGWTLEAAEAVCAGVEGEEVLDLLTRLVDKSLVVVQAGATSVRYRFLETVRQYARDRLLLSGEIERAHRRHRDHFLAWAEASEVQLQGREAHDLQLDAALGAADDLPLVHVVLVDLDVRLAVGTDGHEHSLRARRSYLRATALD